MTWLKANWMWVRWALLALAVVVSVLGARCYAGARVRTALEGARARVRDSVAEVYEATYVRSRDSARLRAAVADKMADSADAANRITRLIADSAIADGKRAHRQAVELQHEIDSLPPRLAEAFDSLQTANAALLATVEALRRENSILGLTLDSLSDANRALLGALADADSALARKDTALAAFRALKTPKPSLLRRVLSVGGYAGVALAGALVGRGLR